MPYLIEVETTRYYYIAQNFFDQLSIDEQLQIFKDTLTYHALDENYSFEIKNLTFFFTIEYVMHQKKIDSGVYYYHSIFYVDDTVGEYIKLLCI